MNEAAKALGSLGGKKRKENSTLEQRREWGKKGGRPKKMALKVTERLIVIGIIYIIFQLFNVKLTVGF
jgi:hypothetical protein